MLDDLRRWLGDTFVDVIVPILFLGIGCWLGLYFGERMGWNDAVAVCVTAPADCKVR